MVRQSRLGTRPAVSRTAGLARRAERGRWRRAAVVRPGRALDQPAADGDHAGSDLRRALAERLAGDRRSVRAVRQRPGAGGWREAGASPGNPARIRQLRLADVERKLRHRQQRHRVRRDLPGDVARAVLRRRRQVAFC